MTLEVSFTIANFPEAKTGMYYVVHDSSRATVDTGAVNAPSNGEVTISMEGKGVPEGDYVQVYLDDFTGVNPTTAGSATDWVEVIENGEVTPPTANFIYTKNKLEVTFDGSTSTDPDGQGLTYAWDYGDGNFATGVAPPAHTYAIAGSYTVELTVTDYVAQESPVYSEVVAVSELSNQLIVIAAGDSITAAGDSLGSNDDRPTNEGVDAYARGHWVSALLVHCESDYIVRDNKGYSGFTTSQFLSIKLAGVLATDANVVMYMLGANDFAAARADLDIQTDYQAIIDQTLAAGKSVFIVPCTYTNQSSDAGTENGQADTLNVWLQNYANNTSGVEIAPVNTAFDAQLMSEAPSTEGITKDGIHPTNWGGMVLGAGIAPIMDAVYPSNFATKQNLIPTFAGTGGSVPYGNGTVPDGWKGFQALSWNGIVDLGDGRAWLEVVTNGSGSNTNSNHKSSTELVTIPSYTEDAWYIAEVRVKLINASAISKIRLDVESVSATYNGTEFTAFTPNIEGAYADGEYRFRTPLMRLGVDGLSSFKFETTQGAGANATIQIAEPMFYKVEDI